MGISNACSKVEIQLRRRAAPVYVYIRTCLCKMHVYVLEFIDKCRKKSSPCTCRPRGRRSLSVHDLLSKFTRGSPAYRLHRERLRGLHSDEQDLQGLYPTHRWRYRDVPDVQVGDMGARTGGSSTYMHIYYMYVYVYIYTCVYGQGQSIYTLYTMEYLFSNIHLIIHVKK
jgi:hypothetical protein